MPVYTVKDLYDLSFTIAAPLFGGFVYPWQLLSQIKGYILRIGPGLDKSVYTQIGEDIWAAKSAGIAKSALVMGPCIIDEDAEIRHGAFIRGSAIVGRSCVVGNSTELKNVILFDHVQVPHFNYIGDSVLGHKAHFGAGVITTNIKSDRSMVFIHAGDEKMETGLQKIGTMAGDGAEVGCNAALSPGCILGKGTIVYPLSHVRGQLPHHHIYKDAQNIKPKR